MTHAWRHAGNPWRPPHRECNCRSLSSFPMGNSKKADRWRAKWMMVHSPRHKKANRTRWRIHRAGAKVSLACACPNRRNFEADQLDGINLGGGLQVPKENRGALGRAAARFRVSSSVFCVRTPAKPMGIFQGADGTNSKPETQNSKLC